MKLTCELARELLAYDPETGLLTWRPRSAAFFPADKRDAEHNAKIWNRRYAGNPAGSLTGRGYVAIALFNKRTYAHRIIFLIMMGRLPLEEVDHKDGVRSNNKWSNLREATAAQNKQNTALFCTNKSGYRGVSRAKHNKWQAQINAGGRVHHLGTFDRAEDAASAYLMAKSELHEFQPEPRPC